MPRRQVVAMRAMSLLPTQRGTTMIEVLVTIVILAFGLLGLVGLQSRLQVSEMEAYQRSQALILLEDMANRISTNRNNAASYVTGADNPVGTGNTCTVNTGSARQVQDRCEWSNALQGAAELSGTSKVGALIGGRGCVESLGSGEYLVTVAWQGMGPISAPPASVACGKDLYNGAANSACVNDRCRRALTTIVRIAGL
ncbi:MAG TPA: type IV pilus modification protein PilV [Noviherbaspirillum sp.]|nr:type IV pilus modification protein PilV [Noviherbaspirillum sp.]